MRKSLLTLFVLLFLALSNVYAFVIPTDDLTFSSLDGTIVPNPFPIYTDGSHVLAHPYENYKEKMLPVNNTYRTQPGCYIGCASKQPTPGSYQNDSGLHVIGQIRIPGHYQSEQCMPQNTNTTSAKPNERFIQLCKASFVACKNNECAIDFNTGWFED